MTRIFSFLRAWMALAALMSLSTAALARYIDCTGPLPLAVNIPAVSVPSDLANGDAIPGARAAFIIPINCTVNPGDNWNMTTIGGVSMVLVAGYPNVYTTTGMGAGVGFRMRNMAGTVLVPADYNGGTATTFLMGPSQLGSNTVQGTFELVKTGTIAAGTFGFSFGVHVPSQEWANGGSEANSKLSFGYTMLAATVPSCSVTTPNVAVSLPTLSVSQLTGVGVSAGTTPFTINLLCATNANTSISLSDAVTPANRSNTLTLNAGSTATGVGIQVLYQAQPLPLGPAPYIYTNSGTPTTTQTALGTRSGAVSIGFQGRYIRTGTPLTPGTINALATFMLSYN